jgi:enterobacterial common antigen flippase
MPAVSLRPAETGSSNEQPSYAQILRSSALIGGASALNLAVGIARTKALAVLLGPAGIGLLGVFSSISDLARSLAQLGINASGVRQIAEAVGSDDAHRIARTVTVLRRVAILLGLLGMLALVALARPISQWSFGSEQHAEPIAWLSLAVFFRLVADGQAAVFQGMRRIADLAKIGVLGSLAGAAVSIGLAAWLGEAGVVPALVAMAAASMLISWWYARAVRVEPVCMSGAEVRAEVACLLKLGLAFMASALLMTGAAFAVRAIVLRTGGAEAAGLYQAAWTLGGLYVGFVLQAMGTDFYPRLVGVIGDTTQSNRIVNEQAQVSLLLAGPGVIATLVFATPIVTGLYSAQFAESIDTLRWICLGMALRVVTWPMGYIIVARNRRLVFFAAELAWTLVNVGLSWLCIDKFGLAGAGIAFFASYVFHGCLVYGIVWRMQRFSWSAPTWRNGSVFVLSIGLVFGAFQLTPASWATAIGAIVLLASGWHSLRTLLRLAPEVLPRSVRRAFARMAAN